MTETISDNKRIAKNTLALYARTFIVVIVALYTSRALLKILGETDLGIYNVVGGIVLLLSVFQSTLTKAIQRFFSYDIGSNCTEEQQSRTFSSCLYIIVIIIGVSILFGETVGLSIVNFLTKIPQERMFAANWVYQFVLLSFCVTFLHIPLDAVIIAHERMSIYALFTIIESVLQLLMIFVLLNADSDKLILYAILHSSISIIIFFCYYYYVKIKFPIYKFRCVWDSKISRNILSFSSWTLLGSSTNVLSQQGVSILLNNFVGLVANTALGFANQVNSALVRFVSGFSTAFNPQIIKLYAQNDKTNLFLLIHRASKFSFALSYIMALPLIVNMDFILHLWLGNVPIYTSGFCKLILICSVIDATTGVFNTVITATGNIKKYQLLISCSFILDSLVVLSLLIFKIHPVLVFGSRIITRGIINMIIGLCISKKQIEFSIGKYLKLVGFPIIATIGITIPFAIASFYIVSDEFLIMIVSIMISIISVSLSTLYIIMNKQERLSIKSIIEHRINGKK